MLRRRHAESENEMSYLALIEARIAGIPCLIGVTEFDPGTPAYTRGHPDNWMEADPGYCNWDVLDRKGRIAPWLAKKLDPKASDEIDELVAQKITDEDNHVMSLAERHGH